MQRIWNDLQATALGTHGAFLKQPMEAAALRLPFAAATGLVASDRNCRGGASFALSPTRRLVASQPPPSLTLSRCFNSSSSTRLFSE